MRFPLASFLFLLGLIASGLGLARLAEIAGEDPAQRGLLLALEREESVEKRIAENPEGARRLVRKLWGETLQLRAKGQREEKLLHKAARLSSAIETWLGDPSFLSATERYRWLGPVEARRQLEVDQAFSRAEALYESSSLAAAEREGRGALERYREMGDGWGELRALHLLGNILLVGGKMHEAGAVYRELLVLAEKRGDRERQVAAINNLASLDEIRGRLGEAGAGYARALLLAEAHGLRRLRGLTQLYLGNLHHQIGLPDRALKPFAKAEADFRALGEIGLEAIATANRGASLQRLGLNREALDAYRDSLRLRARKGDRPGRLRTLLHLAELLAESGESDRALAVLDELLAVSSDSEQAEVSRLFRWGALVTAGDLQLARGQIAASRAAYRVAEEIAEKLNRPLEKAETARRRARLLEAEGRPGEALEQLQQAVAVVEDLRASPESEEERVRFLESRRSVYEDLAGLYLRAFENPERAFDLLERSRSRAFLDLLEGGARISSGESEGPRVILRAATEPEPLGRVAEAVPGDGLLLHYAVAARWLAVLVVDRSGIRVWAIQEVEADELSRLATSFKEEAGRPPELPTVRGEAPTKAGAELARLLLHPAAGYLSGARTLIIVPDDVLFSIPWAALPWGEEGHYLIEKYELAVEPSGAALVRLTKGARRTRRPSALVVANPGVLPSDDATGTDRAHSSIERLTGGLSRRFRARSLPEVTAEATELASLFPQSRLLLGQEAQEGTVRSELPRHRIVHLGTHARIEQEQPLASALLLSAPSENLEEALLRPIAPEDGLLTGFEVLGLRLAPGALVTLAACETAGGRRHRGEGVAGLARAFFEGGATTVVASLWPVEDRSTRELMVRFYRELAGGSRSTAAALGRAQAALAQGIAGESRRHPFFWAGFILLGDFR